MEGLGRVQKPTILCEWFSVSSIDLLMQPVNHDIYCSSGLPQLSVMPSLNFWGLAVFTFFLIFFYPYNVWDFFGPSLLQLLTSSCFLFFSGRFHLLKRFPIIDLGCAFWLCLTAKVFDVCPRLNSHQIPWFRCFPPAHRGLPVRWICLVSLIWRVGGACSFSWSDGQLNCWTLSIVVDAFTREFLRVFKKRPRSVMFERWDLRSSPLPMEISIRIIRLCSRGSASLPPSWYRDSTLISPSSCQPCLISHTGTLPPSKLSVNHQSRCFIWSRL